MRDTPESDEPRQERPAQDESGWKKPSRYAQSLGMALAGKGGGRATMTYTFDEAFANRKGDVHGGVLAGLIDMTMSEAIRSALDDAGQGPDYRGLSTVTMTVNYLEVARGDLTAEARCDRFGRTTGFASAEVRDRAGKLVATGQGAFRIIR